MLKLKKIEIQGFKSFADRTEMRFHGSGVAAVVGPNGCGKSNLSDAISWALGEQSAKSLRGARMEDVIFAGTRDRKPLGMASVTITLTDPRIEPAPQQVEVLELAAGADVIAAAPTGNIPSDKSDKKRDVTITRRLFRSGESEYLVDGKTARLRDIQDIFMGSGLGPESYAIIEQGRIGQILSSRPHDRRAVIEEAAGVTRFKTKRRLAEAKLEGAKANLSFETSDFRVAEDFSHCLCPAGKRLYRNGTNCNISGHRAIRFTGARRDCKNCPLRAQCLRHPQRSQVRHVAIFMGRHASAQETPSERMKRKIDSAHGHEMIARRFATVEPVFGNLRANKKLNRFTLRGRAKVDAQWKLYCLVHNIEKLAHSGYAK